MSASLAFIVGSFLGVFLGALAAYGFMFAWAMRQEDSDHAE